MKMRFLWIIFIICFTSTITITSTKASSCESVKINELLPNPEGIDTGKEWIELYNCSDNTFNLEDWYLVDKANGKQVLSKYYLKPNDYFLLYTTISLNQTDEVISIYSNDGILIDQISYVSSIEEKSLSRIPDGTGDFEITSQTPAESNRGNTIKRDVKINEIYPSPLSEEEEWLEILNNEGEEVSIYNWTISDLSNSFELPDITIPAKSYILVKEDLKISLNNSGDTISLYGSQGELIDIFAYKSTPKGITNARDQNGEIVSSKLPTPGYINQFIDITDEFFALQSLSIKELKASKETDVIISGTMTSEKSNQLEQRQYIQDDTGGILVKLPDKDTYLEIDQTYRLCGSYNTYYSSPIFEIKNENCIQKLENKLEISTKDIIVYEEISENEGIKINFDAKIENIKDQNLSLLFDNNTIKATFAYPQENNYQKDKIYKITGIINQSQENKFKIFITEITETNLDPYKTQILGIKNSKITSSTNPIMKYPNKIGKIYYSAQITKNRQQERKDIITSGSFFLIGNTIYFLVIKKTF